MTRSFYHFVQCIHYVPTGKDVRSFRERTRYSIALHFWSENETKRDVLSVMMNYSSMLDAYLVFLTQEANEVW